MAKLAARTVVKPSTPTTYFKGQAMKMTKAQKKVGKVMGEYKSGKLHSGAGGKVVKSPKQAIAIALSEAKVPMKKGKM